MKQDYYLGLSEEGFHRIAYTEWGSPNQHQNPIICVHGLTRNGRDFDTLAAYMSEREKQVFCPDIVGRGDSDWLKNPLHYTYEQYLADLNVMIARVGTQYLDWVGTSLGGLLGMILASFPSTPIKKLVLNDIGPQIPTKGLMRLSSYGKVPEFNSIEAATEYYKKDMAEMGKLSDAQWTTFATHSVREIAPGKFVAKTDHSVKLSQPKSQLAWKAMMHPLKAFEGSLFDVDLWHIWRNVRCPVLVIHGKNSDILLPSIVKKMQDIHPYTDVVEIDNAGHAPALLNPEEHKLIHEWLMRT